MDVFYIVILSVAVVALKVYARLCFIPFSPNTLANENPRKHAWTSYSQPWKAWTSKHLQLFIELHLPPPPQTHLFCFFFEVIRPGRTNYDDTSPCFLFLMNLSCPMLYHLLVDLPNLKHIHHVIIDISSYIPVSVIKQTIPKDGITVHPVLNSLRLTPAAI